VPATRRLPADKPGATAAPGVRRVSGARLASALVFLLLLLVLLVLFAAFEDAAHLFAELLEGAADLFAGVLFGLAVFLLGGSRLARGRRLTSQVLTLRRNARRFFSLRSLATKLFCIISIFRGNALKRLRSDRAGPRWATGEHKGVPLNFCNRSRGVDRNTENMVIKRA